MIQTRSKNLASNKQIQQPSKNVIFAHKIYNCPIYKKGNYYEDWVHFDKSIKYEYLVNHLKYRSQERYNFATTPQIFNQINSVLSFFTVTNHSSQLKLICKSIQRMFPNLKELVIAITENYFQDNILKIKSFITNFEALDQVTILFKRKKTCAQNDYLFNMFEEAFFSLKVQYYLHTYEMKVGLTLKQNQTIGINALQCLEATCSQCDTYVVTLKQDTNLDILNSINKISSWDCIDLEYFSNCMDNTTPLLDSIKNVYFPHLMFLKIRDQIESIQNLASLRAPFLQSLSLALNKITDTSSLAKFGFLKLQSINLVRNPVLDIQSVVYMNRVLKEVTFAQFNSQTLEPVYYKIGFLGKLEQGSISSSIRGVEPTNNILKDALLRKQMGNELIDRWSKVIISNKLYDFQIVLKAFFSLFVLLNKYF